MIVEETDGFYSAYSTNCEGIYSAGDSIDEIKTDTEYAISLIKANLPEERWPNIIKGEYEIEYQLSK